MSASVILIFFFFVLVIRCLLELDMMVHLWRKVKDVWNSVSGRLNPSRKSPGGQSSGRRCACGATGLLNLQDDVRRCGYRDVEVMWKLLSASQVAQVQTAPPCDPPKGTKKRHSWRAFPWFHH